MDHATFTRICILLVTMSQVLSYPVFGTKRYGRSSGHRVSGYSPMPPTILNHFALPPPSSYYAPYTTMADYETNMDYNYPYTSPYYYAPSESDDLKYTIYQQLRPYYLEERRPEYEFVGYDGAQNPINDGQDEMQQDDGGRSDSLPIGQEQWYENGNQQGQHQQLPAQQESIADVNAAFLQNLILSQMYTDVQNRERATMRRQHLGLAEYPAEEQITDDYVYDDGRNRNLGFYAEDYEDEEVKELKSLARKPNEEPSDTYRVAAPLYQTENNWYDQASWGNGANKRSMQTYGRIVSSPHSFSGNNYDEDTEFELATTETAADAEQSSSSPKSASVTNPPTTEAPDFDRRRGQKEVPLLRPAAPRHQPVNAEIFSRLIPRSGGSGNTRSNPSVYDTIKQLLNMEHGLEKSKSQGDPGRAQPHKRFVTNEESLVDQLGGLKKASA